MLFSNIFRSGLNYYVQVIRVFLEVPLVVHQSSYLATATFFEILQFGLVYMRTLRGNLNCLFFQLCFCRNFTNLSVRKS